MLPKPIIYLSILLVFIYSSCSEPIELDVPETAKQLVVNSIITEGEAVTVSLSTTTSMLAESTPEIADAEVSLWCEDSFITDLVYIGNKHYTTDSVIEADKNYSIIVNAQNNGSLKASCYTPKPIPLTDGYIRYGVLYNNDVGMDLDEVSITFTDAPNEENYYEIGFYELSYQYNTIDGILLIDSTVQEVRNLGNLTSNDPVILAEGDMDFEYIADRSTLIFSDQYIKNPCTLVF